MFIIFSYGKTMNSKILLGLLAVVPLILGGCTNKCGVPTTGRGGDVSALAQGSNIAQNVSDKNNVYFNFGKANLTDDAKIIVKEQANELKASGATSTIEGRTDERGTSEFNMALGAKRAEAVKKELVKNGVNPDSISTISYGKESPIGNRVDFKDPEEYHAINRVATTVVNGSSIGG